MQQDGKKDRFSDSVSIDFPAEPMDGTPVTVPLNLDYTINAAGSFALIHGAVQCIRGRINSGPIVDGRFGHHGTTWEVVGVGPAQEGVVNRLWVEFQFVDDAGQVVTREFTRPFFGTGRVHVKCSSYRQHFSDDVASLAATDLKKPLRLAIATPMFRVGGVERWIASLARWLDPERVCLTKVFVTNEGAWDDIAVSWLPRWVEVVESPHIPNDNSFDVIVTEGLLDLIDLLSGVSKPSIDVQHGLCLSDKRRVKLVETSVAAHLALGTRIVGVNSLVLDNFPTHIRHSITIIENGSDPANAVPLVDRNALKFSLGLPPDAKVALYVGRIAEEKNVQAMIDAVTILGDPWHAVIVGPQFVSLERTCSRVHLISPKPHIGNWLGIADVLCHPSDHESHCFAINDAWFAKVPVVSCDYPANRRFLELHGELGWLVPKRPSRETLAAAIQEAASGRYDPRIDRAWDAAHQYYSVARMGRRWTDYLCSVAAAGHG